MIKGKDGISPHVDFRCRLNRPHVIMFTARVKQEIKPGSSRGVTTSSRNGRSQVALSGRPAGKGRPGFPSLLLLRMRLPPTHPGTGLIPLSLGFSAKKIPAGPPVLSAHDPNRKLPGICE